MRFVRVLLAVAIAIWPVAVRGQGSATDSVRAQRGGRLLLLIQGMQMASSPELPAAVNELLSDTSAHMRMAPRRTATAADSARAADVVKRARAALQQYTDVKLAERDGYV